MQTFNDLDASTSVSLSLSLSLSRARSRSLARARARSLALFLSRIPSMPWTHAPSDSPAAMAATSLLYALWCSFINSTACVTAHLVSKRFSGCVCACVCVCVCCVLCVCVCVCVCV